MAELEDPAAAQRGFARLLHDAVKRTGRRLENVSCKHFWRGDVDDVTCEAEFQPVRGHRAAPTGRFTCVISGGPWAPRKALPWRKGGWDYDLVAAKMLELRERGAARKAAVEAAGQRRLAADGMGRVLEKAYSDRTSVYFRVKPGDMGLQVCFDVDEERARELLAFAASHWPGGRDEPGV